MKRHPTGIRGGASDGWTWIRPGRSRGNEQGAARPLRTIVSAVVALFLLAVTVQLTADEARADPGNIIDFEGLAEGAIVDQVSCGSGISCTDALGGSVAVFGLNPDFPADNAAMIFDATCTPTATGGDDDLCNAALGNVLIITEDFDGTDPDDADVPGARFDFDLSGLGPGTFVVESLTIGDVEGVETGSGANIQVFAGGPGGTLVAEVPIPKTGDGNYAVVLIGATGDFLRINLLGSAAVDNIDIQLEPPPDGEACTPGFWRNHLEDWGPTGFSPSDDFDTTFGVNFFTPDKTLLDAVKLGGGGINKLARFGVAALLNAAHPDVDFALTVPQVIALVQSGDPNAFDGFFDDEDCPID